MYLIRSFRPMIPRMSVREWGLGAIGTMLALLITGMIEHLTGMPSVLLAPLGATAILVFVVPSSPLAQPWSSVMGSLAAGLAAIPAAMLLPMPWAGAVGVGCAIIVMVLIRALHPPGGAVALLTAMTVQPDAPLAVFFPLTVGTLTIVGCGVIWARLTGRNYPMRAPETAHAATAQGGLDRADLEALLVRYRQTANMGAADLGRLLDAAQAEAARSRFQGTTCGDVMTRPLITVPADASAETVADIFLANRIKSLPVTDAENRLLGVIQQGDVIAALIRAEGRTDHPTLRAAGMMRGGTPQVPVSMPVGALLERLAGQEAQLVAVMDQGRIVGVITRSDVIGLLLREQSALAAQDDAQ